MAYMVFYILGQKFHLQKPHLRFGLVKGIKRHMGHNTYHMTYNGVFYNVGCIMETYLHKKHTKNSLFPNREKQLKYTKL